MKMPRIHYHIPIVSELIKLELCRCFLREFQVSSGDAFPTRPHDAWLPNWHRVLIFVENVNTGVWNGTAY